MKESIRDALPGFVGLREFFRRLGDKFEPLVLDESRKDFYIAKIEELRGFPEELFFNMKWAWRIDPHFREARKYPNGVTVVRIGVGIIASGTGLSRDTQNLIMAFDSEDRLLQYTVISGSGKLEKGVKVYTFRDSTRVGEDHDSFDSVERFVRTMGEDDFFIIEDAAFPHQYLQVLSGVVDGKVVYSVEYCLVDFVLHFTLPRYADADCVLRLIAAFKAEGFAALQDAAQWVQMDVDGYWQSNGRPIDVDIGILAHIYRTEILKGDAAAQEMRDIFNTRLAGEKPLVVKVDHRRPVDMTAELLAAANDATRFTASQRKRIELYIYLSLRGEYDKCISEFLRNRPRGGQ